MINSTHAVQFFQDLARALVESGYFPAVSEARFNEVDNKSSVELAVTNTPDAIPDPDCIDVTLETLHDGTDPLRVRVQEVFLDPTLDTPGAAAQESTDRLIKDLKKHHPTMEFESQFLAQKLCEHFKILGLAPHQ